MRAAVLSSLLAVGAVAQPLLDIKRDYVTEIDVVWKTVFTTIDVVATAPAVPVSTAPAAPVAPTSVAPAPAPAAPSSEPAAQPAPQPAKAPAPAPPAADPGMSEYQQAVLNHHNVHRANHSASPLTWSDEMAAIAQQEANVCIFQHDTTTGGGGYGQNIAAGVPGTNISEIITGMFYNGEAPNYASQYGLASPDMSIFEEVGHFTQVVWKGSTSVGCYTADCSAHGGVANAGGDVPPYFTVCNYAPAGNWLGSFGENVGQPLGQPEVTWSYGGAY